MSRLTVWASIDRIRRHWLLWLIGWGDVLYGVVNMFGPTESAYQQLLRDVAPIWAWYALFPLAAVLIALGYSKTGAVVGMFAWLFLVLASSATIYQGSALSYGGPILLGLPMGFHFLILWDVGTGLDADRERRQRA